MISPRLGVSASIASMPFWVSSRTYWSGEQSRWRRSSMKVMFSTDIGRVSRGSTGWVEVGISPPLEEQVSAAPLENGVTKPNLQPGRKRIACDPDRDGVDTNAL